MAHALAMATGTGTSGGLPRAVRACEGPRRAPVGAGGVGVHSSWHYVVHSAWLIGLACAAVPVISCMDGHVEGLVFVCGCSTQLHAALIPCTMHHVPWHGTGALGRSRGPR